MTVPYSDNLYSALDDEDDDFYAQSNDHVESPAAHPASGPHANETPQHDEDEALSPSDGYFHASDAVAYEPAANRQSSNVPVVPNVLVEDPTLRDDDRDTKTREAEHERRLSTMAALQQQASPQLARQSASASSFRPQHSHRRSVEEDEDNIRVDTDPSPALGHPQQQPQESRPGPSETSPLFQQQHFDAPPAYTPSPTARSHPSRQDHTPSPVSTSSNSVSYQTFGSPPTSAGASMGVPSEHQRLLPNREPESMGGDRSDQGPRTLRQRFRRAFTPSNGRAKLARVLKWLMIFFIAVGILSIFSSMTISWDHVPSDHKKPGDPSSPPGDDSRADPNPNPNPPANPGKPEKPSRPPVTHPGDGQSDLVWKPRVYCRQPEREFSFTTVIGAEFTSSRSYSILQKMYDVDDQPGRYRRPNVEGEVIIRRASSQQSQTRGSAKVEVLSNEKNIITNVEVDDKRQELRVQTPNQVNWPYVAGPCIQMRITLFAPAGSALETLTVNTTQLNINIAEGLQLGVEREAFLRTIAGNINAPVQKVSAQENKDDPYFLSTRKTIIETVSGDVNGWFALNDLLKVISISGDLTLDIAPKPADPDLPARAELKLETISGDISAFEPIDSDFTKGVATSESKFPGRDYYTDVSTTSGKVNAKLAFSSYASFRSQSGDLHLELWPVLDPSEKDQSRLGTNTKSGNTNMSLLEPFWTDIVKPQDQRLEEPRDGDGKGDQSHNGDEPWLIIHPHDAFASDNSEKTKRSNDGKRALGNLVSKHGTISGDTHLQYPSSWEGHLVAETLSGTQRIREEGLEVYDVSNPLMKSRTGKKGSGASDMKVMSVSGNEDVLIGRDPA